MSETNEIEKKNLYSRQILTYGSDAMNKIQNYKILIMGLRGLGIEIAKNLILAGPKEVSISDKNICKINDLGSNFYINEGDINVKSLEDSCFDKLNTLNPNVKVTKHKGIQKEDIKKFDIIIISEIMNLEDLYEINNLTRKYKKYFIYTLNLGLTGFLFNDFGENHPIYDSNGEKKLSYEIFNIEEKENSYEIYINIKDDKPFELHEGDYVTFKNVKGLESLNDLKPRKIINANNSSFEIENDKKYNGRYISDGIVEEFKPTKYLKFETFKDNFIKPNNNYTKIDASKKKSNILLHCAFVGLHLYYNIYNNLPELNNLEQVEEIVKLSKSYYLVLNKQYTDYLTIKTKIIEFDRNYIINVLRWSKAEINPICTFLGGIVSQEALKKTGKYTPIYQWLRFDFFETIENLPNDVNRNLLNCRYDDQISIFGQELQEKLKNLNIFMVGAGALGCEYIKNFCLMGISCNRGKITITDNDSISLSNLNRQFLFHKNDVKEKSYKSFCAKREALKINKSMNIQDYSLLINDDTRDIFSDEFIENQDILISAVDNLKARKYIDNLSTFFNKIYINSGTEGTKANSDIYYPNKSICMNDLTFEVKEEIIPMCTLRNRPTKIEHCIGLSKDVFEKLFIQSITNIKKILEDEQQFYSALDKIDDREKLYLTLNIYKNIFYILENPSQYLIIKYAIFIFTYYFKYMVNIYIRENSASYSNITSNDRPSPIEINLEDNNVVLYFKSFYFIFSNIINFNEELDIEKIKTEISNEKINISEEFIDNQKQRQNFNEEISSLKNKQIIQERINSMKQIDFEKDNDENYHINFILSFSNLRASNFNMEKIEFLNAKKIAGNIIPAIASTTAAVTGISCLQIYILLQTDNLRSFRNSDFNLGTGIFDLYIPEEKRFVDDYINNENILVKKAIPGEYTAWDKIDIIGPNKTVRNFVDDFKDKYNVNIDYINYNELTLASPIDEDEDELDKTIEELFKENIKLYENTKYIRLEISGNYEGVEVCIPTIKYILKN